MAQVLGVSDNGDGTHTVTVATVNHGQAQVVVPADSLDHPDIHALYAQVSDMDVTAYTVLRRSARDRRRYSTNPPDPGLGS